MAIRAVILRRHVMARSHVGCTGFEAAGAAFRFLVGVFRFCAVIVDTIDGMSVQTKKAITLSLIIPAYNEENYLRACLNSIARQSVMPDEVILVNNNSTDHTVAIAREYPFITIINESTQGIVSARNAGFNKAAHNIIGRIDADSVLPKNWVKDVKQYYSDEKNMNNALTGGGVAYNIRLKRLSGWLLNQVAYRTNKVILGHYILWGSNMAFTRSQWKAVKNNTCMRDDIHEDLDLSIHLYRLGYAIDYRPSLQVEVVLKRIYSDRAHLHAHMRRWPQTLHTHQYHLWWMGIVGNIILWTLFLPLLYSVEFFNKYFLQRTSLRD